MNTHVNPASAAAALFLRPLPTGLVTGAEAVRFGGKPRLPAGLEWPARLEGYLEKQPVADHFIAEIDLSRLPREFSLADQTYTFPELPQAGTIFIFLPLLNDAIYDTNSPSVLYTPEDVTGFPEREPPDALPDVRVSEFDHVHADGLTDEGRVLTQRVAEALPFLSARAVNPLAVNMAKAEGAAAASWRGEHASHEEEMARVHREARPMPPDLTIRRMTDAERAAKQEMRPQARRIREVEL
ncbi:MAG: DUF1963 domain-containing protein [Paracoccaceae bacterium]|nr:DUF1963 domain-containing protein [Paracoccaceae bacterium]